MSQTEDQQARRLVERREFIRAKAPVILAGIHASGVMSDGNCDVAIAQAAYIFDATLLELEK